jgi:hypothetical protein
MGLNCKLFCVKLRVFVGKTEANVSEIFKAPFLFLPSDGITVSHPDPHMITTIAE